ncbi:MAG: hypothetical protein FWE23_10500 [Chitinivibrionia bacterium]|nr:hypothetical protein [Chitinivibrionia bacterium]
MSQDITVFARWIGDLAYSEISFGGGEIIYAASEISPNITASHDGVLLAAGAHFTVSLANNINVGTAQLTITAVENSNYFGSKTVDFDIFPANLKIIASDKTVIYGAPIPGDWEFTVEGVGGQNSLAAAGVMGAPEFSTDYNPSSPIGASYKISPSVGSMILGNSNYKFVFVDGVLRVNERTVVGAEITVLSAHDYTGLAQIPTFEVVVNGVNLVAGTDFTATFANNINAGENTAIITVSGIGNYSGEANAKLYNRQKTDRYYAERRAK